MNASILPSTRHGLAWLAGGLAVGLLAATLVGPALGTVRAQSPTPDPVWPFPQRPHTISVNGVGRVKITPDVADVQVGVTFQAKEAKEAADLAANAMDAVVTALLEAGIDEKDIQTTQLSLNPIYDWNVNPPRIDGWEAANMVNVTVRDVSAAGDIVDAATAAGATNVGGITFRVDDPAEAEAEARSAAVADARTRADQLAADAGVNIVGVISITEVSFNPPQPIFLERSFAAAEGMDTAATPVLAGQVEISVTVSIEYEIE